MPIKILAWILEEFLVVLPLAENLLAFVAFRKREGSLIRRYDL